MKVTSDRKIPIVPSVTIKESILPLVARSPFTTPASRPTTSPAIMPAINAVGSGQPDCASSFMIMIIKLAINAAIAPTDKSICPVTITNVPPTLMIPMNALLVKTLLKLFHDRKLGFNKTPITTSKSSAISGPRVCAHFAMLRQLDPICVR